MALLSRGRHGLRRGGASPELFLAQLKVVSTTVDENSLAVEATAGDIDGVTHRLSTVGGNSDRKVGHSPEVPNNSGASDF